MDGKPQTTEDVPAVWLALIARYDASGSAPWNGVSRRRTARRTWPSQLKELMAESQNHRCPYCGTRMDESWETYPTLEHIKPLCRGGIDWISNMVVACRACNEGRSQDMHRVRRERKRRKRINRKQRITA